MNNLAENMKIRMRELKLTQTELAKKAGISQVTVHKILAGKISNSSRIVDLARALDTSPEWLLYGVGEPTAEYLLNSAPSTRLLPLLEYDQVDAWLTEKVEFGGEDKITAWEIAPPSTSSKAFWLKVLGDSMTAASGLSIPEGNLILVDTARKAKTGSLVIARLEGNEQILFKQYATDGIQKYLKPLNTSYNMIEIDNEDCIIGVVLEAKLKLD